MFVVTFCGDQKKVAPGVVLLPVRVTEVFVQVNVPPTEALILGDVPEVIVTVTGEHSFIYLSIT